jgi:hypothetical protein
MKVEEAKALINKKTIRAPFRSPRHSRSTWASIRKVAPIALLQSLDLI